MTLEAWLVTDIGVVRDHNEDSAFMEAKSGVFVVADGMGGHAAGEIASAMAVENVRRSIEGSRAEIDAFRKTPTDAGRRGIVQLLQDAVLAAHQAVYQRGQNESDKAGMGTTLDVVLIAGPEAFVAHVGDSRTYLIRDGRSSQITTDHTVAEVLVIEGKLTIEEAQVSPLRTILVNAIGVSADVGVEMAHVTLKRGDRLLLCSDGLHDYFPTDEEIAQRLGADATGEALTEMVELAKTRGGHDNITGVAVHVVDLVASVPTKIEGDATAPVAVPSNAFDSDERTETALTPPPGEPPRPVAAKPRQTQPMRIAIDDASQLSAIGNAATIPPPPAKLKPVAAVIPKIDPKADAAAKKTVTTSDPSKPGTKSDRRADKENQAAPTEISTADTGRVVIPKDKPSR